MLPLFMAVGAAWGLRETLAAMATGIETACEKAEDIIDEGVGYRLHVYKCNHGKSFEFMLLPSEWLDLMECNLSLYRIMQAMNEYMEVPNCFSFGDVYFALTAESIGYEVINTTDPRRFIVVCLRKCRLDCGDEEWEEAGKAAAILRRGWMRKREHEKALKEGQG